MTTAKSFTSKRLAAALGLGLGLGLAILAGVAQAAATITIQNLNVAGVGFNDRTPAVPVGGNTGTTLGQQRLIAFQAAADQWGATLTSTQTIVIRASFEPLTCTANSAVLGSAGAYNIRNNFPGAGKANTWYPQALANKLSGINLSNGDPVNGQPRITLQFILQSCPSPRQARCRASSTHPRRGWRASHPPCSRR